MLTPDAPDGRMDLRAETERIDVTSALPRPDKKWTYTDRHGHEHRWDDGYPTLVVVTEEPYWCPDCHDEHTDSHYECPLCGEEIAPGLVPAPLYREYIPGMTTYYLNDEEISEAEYRRLAEQIAGRGDADA
jgi:hypothetical protein